MKAISRFLVVMFVALIAVPALAVTQTITTAVQLLATTVLMMGGTGTPLADTTIAENQIYMSTMLNGLFVQAGLHPYSRLYARGVPAVDRGRCT